MSEIDPYEREAAKAAIKVLQRDLAEARKERDKWACECGENMKLLKETIATATRAIEQRDTLAEAVNKYTIEHAKRGAVSTATIDQLEQSLAAVKGGKL
jgi:hypothetical protein